MVKSIDIKISNCLVYFTPIFNIISYTSYILNSFGVENSYVRWNFFINLPCIEFFWNFLRGLVMPICNFYWKEKTYKIFRSKILPYFSNPVGIKNRNIFLALFFLMRGSRVLSLQEQYTDWIFWNFEYKIPKVTQSVSAPIRKVPHTFLSHVKKPFRAFLLRGWWVLTPRPLPCTYSLFS